MADFDRFRSFAERYIIARADKFRVGFEREDAWEALLAAKTIYGSVAMMARSDTTDAPEGVQSSGQQAGVLNGPGPMPNWPPAPRILPPPPPPVKVQKHLALRQAVAGPPAAQGAPSQWGQMISDAFKKFSGTSTPPPQSLLAAAKDHIANGGKIP